MAAPKLDRNGVYFVSMTSSNHHMCVPLLLQGQDTESCLSCGTLWMDQSVEFAPIPNRNNPHVDLT